MQRRKNNTTNRRNRAGRPLARRSLAKHAVRLGHMPSSWRSAILALAALPVFQAASCFPDPLAALNFELQSFINTLVINAANIIIQNLLGL